MENLVRADNEVGLGREGRIPHDLADHYDTVTLTQVNSLVPERARGKFRLPGSIVEDKRIVGRECYSSAQRGRAFSSA